MRDPFEQYKQGYRDGYREAKADMQDFGAFVEKFEEIKLPKKRPGRKKSSQTPKQKLLTKMTKKKWDKYKKGRGRKTYVEIRAEVSRSQAFKKAAKRL